MEVSFLLSSFFIGVDCLTTFGSKVPWDRKQTQDVSILVPYLVLCSIVIQLAKMDGSRVIASAGSEEKVNFMKEIGADVTFNHKTTDAREVLQKEGPIDMYVVASSYDIELG